MPVQEIITPTDDDRLAGWHGPGWYFWDESVHINGPYSTQQYCEESETRYRKRMMNSMLDPDEPESPYTMSDGDLLAEVIENRKRLGIFAEFARGEYQRGFERGSQAERARIITIIKEK